METVSVLFVQGVPDNARLFLLWMQPRNTPLAVTVEEVVQGAPPARDRCAGESE